MPQVSSLKLGNDACQHRPGTGNLPCHEEDTSETGKVDDCRWTSVVCLLPPCIDKIAADPQTWLEKIDSQYAEYLANYAPAAGSPRGTSVPLEFFHAGKVPVDIAGKPAIVVRLSLSRDTELWYAEWP